MSKNNRMWFNQYGQITADNTLLNAEDVKPDVINGATGEAVIPTTTTGAATGSTASDPVKDFYGNYLAEQEKLTNDYYAGVVKGLEDKEKAAQEYYAGVVADINQREQETQNYYRNAMVLAMTDMENARQTYGAKAEELAQAGLSDSGLSDYAARQFYSAYVNEKQAIRGEENSAMGALAAERADAAAKHKLDLATIADEKSKAAFDQQGALSDLSYQRAEYEAGKQATTDTEKDAAEQKGIAAYNALSLLMSPTDAEGNEKTALSFQQAVQELRNQGVSEDAIKEATGKYVDSVKVAVSETVSKGSFSSLSTITSANLAPYVTDGILTQEEADAYIEQAQSRRVEMVENAFKSDDTSVLAEWMVAAGHSEETIKNATEEQLINWFFDAVTKNEDGAFSAEERERILQVWLDQSIVDSVNGDEVIATGTNVKDDAKMYQHYLDGVSVSVVSATRKGIENRRVILSLGGKELALDTDPEYPIQVPADPDVGTIIKQNGGYYVYYRDGANTQWRKIDFWNGAGNNAQYERNSPMRAVLEDLIDKIAIDYPVVDDPKRRKQ
ncbi:MAG: hypothetical protein J6W31_06030 [Clostridia bacterium]|nr:hypothetical protein [Clostridia bacterium]